MLCEAEDGLQALRTYDEIRTELRKNRRERIEKGTQSQGAEIPPHHPSIIVRKDSSSHK